MARLPRTAIIGVGNEFRSDDRVGLEVIRRLENSRPPEADLIEFSSDGASLIVIMRKYDRVVIVDAVRSDETVGTVHCFNAIEEPIPTGLFNYSTHAFSVAESIEVLRRLGDLPVRLHVLGVVGGKFDFGDEITPAVRGAIDQIVEQVQRLISA